VNKLGTRKDDLHLNNIPNHNIYRYLLQIWYFFRKIIIGLLFMFVPNVITDKSKFLLPVLASSKQYQFCFMQRNLLD